MLRPDEIQAALHASRVVDVPVANPHGPLGLEQLAANVAQIVDDDPRRSDTVQRSIRLPMETWEKLDGIASRLRRSGSTNVSASDVATSLVVQGVESVALESVAS